MGKQAGSHLEANPDGEQGNEDGSYVLGAVSWVLQC